MHVAQKTRFIEKIDSTQLCTSSDIDHSQNMINVREESEMFGWLIKITYAGIYLDSRYKQILEYVNI